MSKIIAHKNGITKHFGELAWRALPAHKNGWKVEPPEIAERAAKAEQIITQNKEAATEATSGGLNLGEAVEQIKQLETVEQVNVYAFNDGRKGIETAAKKRIKEIENGKV